MQKEATHRNWWRIESEINETSSDYFPFRMDKRNIFGYFKLGDIYHLDCTPMIGQAGLRIV